MTGVDDTTNGSAGRFLRIEEKLDTLISLNGAFQLDVVQRLTRLEEGSKEARGRIEEAVARAKEELAQSAVEARGKVSTDAAVARNVVTDEASDRTYLWMRLGIGASIAIGLIAIGLRFLGR